MDLRNEQKKILDSDPKLTIGDVTTVNLTQIYVSKIIIKLSILFGTCPLKTIALFLKVYVN